jgi:2-keto-4-pentenoate hydratase/2-oxohepta-3-ene-1,7-dioic acid hydratase in catechol pathway
MLLVTFSEAGRTRMGIWDRANAEIVDLSQAIPNGPTDMLTFIGAGETGLTEARRALASGNGRLPLAQVNLLAPIPRPARNIICVGKNYHDHAYETLGGRNPDAKIPEVPIIFTKSASSVIGVGEPILASLDPTQSTDYEGELAVIFGRNGRGIAKGDVMKYVYGYTIINDVTARILQRRHNQWFIGKSLDTFCPMGPAILTADEVQDVRELRLQTYVNGELRQNAQISEMIFDIPTLIETVAQTMTVDVGDLLSTGTPGGVGMANDPPRFLTKGDVVKVAIEPIGELENPIA